jgi:DNA-binding GntR family transcriptional regulator
VLDAISRRDAAAARERMVAHLAHIESHLVLGGNGHAVDLHALFAHARPARRSA